MAIYYRRHSRLTSPGALITNFSGPDLTAHKGAHETLVSYYLFPKKFNEGGKEGAICNGYLCDSREDKKLFVDLVKGHFDEHYGYYITRQVIDLAEVIIPWIRIANNHSTWKEFFSKTPAELGTAIEHMRHFHGVEGGDIIVEPEA